MNDEHAMSAWQRSSFSATVKKRNFEFRSSNEQLRITTPNTKFLLQLKDEA